MWDSDIYKSAASNCGAGHCSSINNKNSNTEDIIIN